LLYTTSASLLVDLNASLADKTLPLRLRHYQRPELLMMNSGLIASSASNLLKPLTCSTRLSSPATGAARQP
jgi:hypothetical protein